MRLAPYACVLMLLSAGAAVGCSSANQTSTPPPATSAPPAPVSTAPPVSQIAADLAPFHGDLTRGVRPAETIRVAYEFAARHPEVLKYVPCFCGCERGGHTGNADCFVGARDKAGKVTEWEMHGMVCEVCIDVAQQAMQMHNSGASLTAIRKAVEERFAGARFHTPTPVPPAKGTKGH
jgi:hypothetical protein